MRRLLTLAAAVAFALAISVPAAQAQATKYEFHDVTFSNGQTGTIYASTKTMKKKPDNVSCGYQTEDYQFLGYYFEFVEPAPTDAASVREFCLAHFDERQQ